MRNANQCNESVFHSLTKELELTSTLTFEKIEATAEDVIVLFNTPW
jgi:hypothetical protein